MLKFRAEIFQQRLHVGTRAQTLELSNQSNHAIRLRVELLNIGNSNGTCRDPDVYASLHSHY